MKSLEILLGQRGPPSYPTRLVSVPKPNEPRLMHELPETRYSLLLQLREKSNDAWEEFLQVYEQAIYAFCRHRGLQDSDARDVTQDVFVAIHDRLRDWDASPDKGRFRGWLFRVARNIAVNKFLERSRRSASGDSQTRELFAELPASEEAHESALLREYRHTLMHWAARQVKPHVQPNSWLAFWKTAIEGQKAEQVATELGVTVGSVYTAKCRVFARIKAVVESIDEDSFDFQDHAQ